MLSVMSPSQPFISSRPKLSLQTSLPPAPISQIRHQANLELRSDNTSPTVQNTYANTFDVAPSTPSIAPFSRADCPPFSTNPSFPLGLRRTPFHHDAPYTLPLGTHSILRNSPLPRHYLHSRRHRMFPPIKRVSFGADPIQEFIPTPVIEGDDPEAEAQDIQEIEERRPDSEMEEGPEAATQDKHEVQRRRREIEVQGNTVVEDHLCVGEPTGGMQEPMEGILMHDSNTGDEIYYDATEGIADEHEDTRTYMP